MAKKTKTGLPLPTPPPLIVPTTTYAQRMQGLSRPDRVTPVIPPPMINNLSENTDTGSNADLFNTSIGKQASARYTPSYGTTTPTHMQGLVNSTLGTTYGYNTGLQGNNTVGYVDQNGNQMYTGDLSGNQEAMDYFRQNPNVNSGSISSNLMNTLQNKDLMTGLSGLASAIGTGADIYNKFLGPQADATKAEIRNANAQAAYNEAALKHKKDFYAGLANSGLVAKGV